MTSDNICRHHLEMAKALLLDPEFLNRFSGYYLVLLAKNHLEIARQIIETPALCDILTNTKSIGLLANIFYIMRI